MGFIVPLPSFSIALTNIVLFLHKFPSISWSAIFHELRNAFALLFLCHSLRAIHMLIILADQTFPTGYCHSGLSQPTME